MQEARKRRLAGGGQAALSMILLVGLLIAVNYLANRHHLRHDFTANRSYSLSDQTRRVLAALDQEVDVIAFYRTADVDLDPVRDLLREYDDLSPRLSFEVVDPDRQPGRARRYSNLEYGTTVVAAGDRTERVRGSDEQEFTNALIKVTREERKRIAFLAGHGEHDLQGGDDRGYSGLRDRLLAEGYEVEAVNLSAGTPTLEGMRVIVIAGATKELLAPEREAIAAYLDRGGSAFVLADPPPGAAHAELLRPFGLEVGNDLVVDVSGVGRLFGADEFLPVGLEYGSHPITERFNLTTLYPLARSVRLFSGAAETTDAREIVFTAPASWAEARPERRPIRLDEGDRQGPVPVMVALSRRLGPEKGTADGASPGDPAAAGEPADVAEPADIASAAARQDTAGAGEASPPPQELRLVVAGDSDFCANAYASFVGNLDLALNAIGWLAEEEDLIAIRPRGREDRRVHLTQTQATMVGSLLLLGLPLAAVTAGVAVWWRRR